MKKDRQHQRHASSKIGELAGTAVRNAQQRRALTIAELESVTGGALADIVDWNIKGGRLAMVADARLNAVDFNPTQALAGAGLTKLV